MKTESEIAEEMFARLSEADIFTLKTVKTEDSMGEFHHSVGQWIRNEYHLWEVDWAPEIVDGVDCSPNHPDAISSRILRKIWRLVHER